MNTPQVITSGIDYVPLIVPVVLVLFGWIAAVVWADSHPDVRRTGAARRALPGQAAAPHAEATLAAGAADEAEAGSGERLAGSDSAARTGTDEPASPGTTSPGTANPAPPGTTSSGIADPAPPGGTETGPGERG